MGKRSSAASKKKTKKISNARAREKARERQTQKSDFIATKSADDQPTAHDLIKSVWIGRPLTATGAIAPALFAAATGLVLVDDLGTIFQRVGIWCILLILVLVVASLARRALLPEPSMAVMVTAILVWMVGVAAVISVMWISSAASGDEGVSDEVQTAAKGLDLAGSMLGADRFDGEDLAASDMSGGRFVGTGFANANLSESDFRDAIFDGVDFSGTRLCAVDARGTDFSSAINLDDVADWRFMAYDDRTKFPEGFREYQIDGLIKVSAGTRTSFVFSCEEGVNRVLELAAD